METGLWRSGGRGNLVEITALEGSRDCKEGWANQKSAHCEKIVLHLILLYGCNLRVTGRMWVRDVLLSSGFTVLAPANHGVLYGPVWGQFFGTHLVAKVLSCGGDHGQVWQIRDGGLKKFLGYLFKLKFR